MATPEANTSSPPVPQNDMMLKPSSEGTRDHSMPSQWTMRSPTAHTSFGPLPQIAAKMPSSNEGCHTISPQPSRAGPQEAEHPRRPRSYPWSRQVSPGGGAPSHCSTTSITSSPQMPVQPDVSNEQSSLQRSPVVWP